MSGNNKDTTALILAAMDDLGPADARTIAEKADVGYSTAVRKLRDWSTNGEISKIDRGTDPAHYELLPTDQPLPDHLQPAHMPTPTGALFDDVDERDCEDTDQAYQPTESIPTETGEQAAEVETQPEEDHHGDTADVDDNTVAAADLVTDPATDIQPDGDGGGKQEQDREQDEPLTEPATETDDQVEAVTADEQGDATPDQDPPAEETVAEGEEAGEAPTGTEPDGQGDDDAAAPQPTPDTTATGKAPRRPKSYFHTESMAILRANPDRAYTVGEVAKLILAKEIGAGAPASTKVSSGAISNALFKAAGAGECLVVKEKDPATFQAA